METENIFLDYEKGILEEEARNILQQFFSEMLFREKEALFYDRRVILHSV